jgi:hypothetical protein
VARTEWDEQVKLAALLDRWLDPDCSCWTATDPVAGTATTGAMRKKRGVKPGVPDTLVWYCGKTIAIEMKSASGKCSPAQREFREKLLCARVEYWVCRTANAAMWAARRSGVRFRTIVHENGATETWCQPRLPDWEKPRRDPSEPRAQHPEIARQRNAAARRRRALKREREAELAAQRRIESDFPSSAPGNAPGGMPPTASTAGIDGGDHRLSRGETPMTYDHWKSTNPQDEWLGPEPPPYDADDDFSMSIDVAYEAVRERVANGGPRWTAKT